MIRRPPRATRTDTLFPYTTLVRSCRLGPQSALRLAILEPNTEGRLAATLARHDEGPAVLWVVGQAPPNRSEEHTSELQSLMRISYAVFCLKKKKKKILHHHTSE